MTATPGTGGGTGPVAGRRAGSRRGVTAPPGAALRRTVAFAALQLRLLWRFRLMAVYLAVCLFYVAVLRLVPGEFRPLVLALVLYTDPAILGFLFAAGMVLLERDQGTYAPIFVSPTRPIEYLAAFAFVFVLLAVAAALVITLGAGTSIAAALRAALWVVPASITFTMMGLGVAAASHSINQFLGRGAPALALFNLPMVAFFGLVPWAAVGWVPGAYPLARFAAVLLAPESTVRRAAEAGLAPAWGVVATAVWPALASWWGSRRFTRRVVRTLGGA